MKIAVWHHLPSGGGKRALYYHVRGLVERGHTVEVWRPPSADTSYLPLNQLAAEHIVPLDWQPRAARNPLARPLASYHNVLGRMAAMDRHCRRCAEQINRGGFDLLFANGCKFFHTAPIGRYADLPSVLYLQEPYRPLYEAQPRLPWLAIASAPPGGWWRPGYIGAFLRDAIRVQALRIQAREEVASAQAFTSILVNSLYSRESVLRAYGLAAQVCYLGVDTQLFQDRSQPREAFVIGLGGFTFAKNIPFAIEALARARPPRPRLVWVGNANNMAHMEAMQRLADAAGVDFEPKLRVSDEQLIDLLNRAMAMLYAPRLEPFGFAPLEANACGAPVIAVAEGGVRETIVDGANGLLVEAEPQAMAQAIDHLRDHPDIARTLGANGRRMVERQWSIDASIDRLEQRFAQAIERAREKPR
jgi:glycosyltransferase involved in cell wall biosynthesis